MRTPGVKYCRLSPMLIKRLFVFLLVCVAYLPVFAQPANDNCTNAAEVVIGNSGFGMGTFSSAQFDLTKSTLQSGETFAPSITVSGLNKKSAWFKFTLPTTRAVRVSLVPVGSTIQAGNVGFTVYRTNSCLPGNAQISSKLSPIETFGSTFNPCVQEGDYLVQVSANNEANGPIYITVDISDSTNAPYDKPKDALKFGKVSNNRTTAVEYVVECQSIDNAAEVCLPNGSFKNYNKSTWHTFTTPDYFDFFAVFLGIMPGNYNMPKKVIGYRLFEGDATTTALSSLVQVGGCDSLVTDIYSIGRKVYRCGELKTNKTYTLQLLYSKDFNETVRLAVSWDGNGATVGHNPTNALPTPNKIGNIVGNETGFAQYFSDQFGCNSRHTEHSCPKSMPSKGVTVNGYNYNLSSFFNFTLTTTTTLQLYAYQNYCGPQLLLRVFKQSLTANCTDLDTSKLIASYLYNNTLPCLEPGNYVLQVMGVDSLKPEGTFSIGSLYNSGTYPLCLMHNLGGKFDLVMIAKNVNGGHNFSLQNVNAVDKINGLKALQKNVTYKGVSDTFGCANTVLPDVGMCNYANDTSKVVYREFKVSDSMMMTFTSIGIPYSKLYQGSASELANAQSKFSFPQRITGLQPWSNCMWYGQTSEPACVVPGTYTFATFGGPGTIGQKADITILGKATETKHATPATAQNMGSLWDSAAKYNITTFYSDVDTFSCRDNSDILGKLALCGDVYTKVIFRQFYLSSPALLNISLGVGYYTNYNGTLTLLKGKISDGVNGLTSLGAPWNCFTNAGISDQCNPLAPGWYTVLASANGPSYNKPVQVNGSQSSLIGAANQFTITINTACETPKFNRPFKASVDTNTKKPYLIEWKQQASHTSAYPVTFASYNLQLENFNCIPDTPFSKHPITACAADLKHVAYWVFTTTQESYMQIDTKGYWASLFAFDVRKDSAKMTSQGALQECLRKQGQIQICKLQPGTYTLAVFSDTRTYCHSVQPTVYIDQVGYSRFDHASKAYDFGVVKADSSWFKGKQGDVNPLNSGRAASNDFFYCTTGAQEKDPTNSVCYSQLNPNIYKSGVNNVLHPKEESAPQSYEIDRRNLWYTFVVNKPGTVKVKVENKTSGKTWQYPFSVYKSDVNGTIPFADLVNSGEVDSTLLQGLVYVSNNYNYYYCQGSQEIQFYNEPCAFEPVRYYVLVENRNSYGYADAHAMNPNHQVEVSVLVDEASTLPTKFDHYFQASNIGEVNSGKKKGELDNFSCATGDLTDPTYAYNCQKTLWYKFTTSTTGTLRYKVKIGTQNLYGDYYIQLFQQTIAGDSTSKGLQYLPLTSYHYDPSIGNYWSQRCISPGTYYLILPGCSVVNEDVFPEIEVVEQAGDFCSRPMVTSLNGKGSKVVGVTVDCHTIGTDYGEFNPTLTCPAGADKTKFKSSWYRIDVGGKDTLDVTVFINEQTNAGSSEIKYRMMTGNCGAMQEQSCVQDALTKNTYKCLAPGTSYYIQVFTPVVNSFNQYVTGDIDLNISAINHVDTCLPSNSCIAVANFNTEFDCTKDKAVQFINFSTYGTSIAYEWDFGYNNQKSNAVSPRFVYPALTTNKSYDVTLIVTNTSCGRKDSITQTINVAARPAAELGRDTSMCVPGSSIKLDATSHSGSTYQWSNGATTASTTFNYSGNHWVQVSYKGCVTRDTIDVYISPIQKKSLQTVALCKVDQVTLTVSRGYGEKYKWNTGATSGSITTSLPGYYYADVFLNGCAFRDSFLVVSTALQPLGSDTNICQAKMPLRLNATVSGASSYKWQDNSTSSSFTATKPGKYWVTIDLSGCLFSDTIEVRVDSFKTVNKSAVICEAQSYMLPSGKKVFVTGNYTDTLKNANGCDSIITKLSLKVIEKKINNVKVALCAGDSYTMPGGFKITSSGQFSDTLRSATGCDSLITNVTATLAILVKKDISELICAGSNYTLPSGKKVSITGIYPDTLRYVAGCDSVIFAVNLTVYAPVRTTVTGSFCSGKSYQLPSGLLVNKAGRYTDTLKSVNGCDSIIITTNLSFLPALTRSFNATICAGSAYLLPSGKAVTLGGVYVDTLKSISGCDSLVNTITLTLDEVKRVSTNALICAGATYTMPAGGKYSVAGTYVDTLMNIRGCDSLITTVQLSLTTVTRKTMEASICKGAAYLLPSGKPVTASGEYADTLRYKAGCDSIVYTIKLVVFSPQNITLNTAICDGKNYLSPSGKLFSKAGTYKDTLKNILGCDSMLYSIKLDVIPFVVKNFDAVICEGNSYVLPSGRSVSKAGVYADTLRSISGCDSVISNITLTVETPVRKTISELICEGSVYQFPSGYVVNKPGIYSDTIRNMRGCDSLISNISISFKFKTESAASVTICAGQTYLLPSGKVVSTAGLYTDVLVNSTGCDSIIKTTVIVRDPLKAMVKGQESICAGGTVTLIGSASGGLGSGYVYSWSVPGAKSDTFIFTPTATTNVVLTVTDGCTKQAAQYTFIVNVIPLPKASFVMDAKDGCTPHTVRFSNTSSTVPGTKWKWDFGTGIARDTSNQINPTFRYGTPGKYVVKLFVTAPAGCTDEFIDTVTVISKPEIYITGVSEICAGESVSFTGSSNSNNIQSWQWNFGNGNTSANLSAGAQVYNTGGEYYIQLIGTANAACPDTAIHKLIVRPKPNIRLNIREAKICPGQSIQLLANDGVKFEWSPAEGLNNPNINFPIATPTKDTKYVVTVTSAYGCISKDSVDIKVSQPFTISTTGDKIICAGEQVQLGVSGTAVRYEWFPSYSLDSKTSMTPIAKPDTTTTYTVVGYGNDNCFTEKQQVTVTVVPLPIVSTVKQTVISYGSTLPLATTVSPDVTQYLWSPPTYLNCLNCPMPLSTPKENITYKVTVSNAAGCTASDTLRVTLTCSDADVFLPNTFTPNGDGANDVFYPRGKGIRTVKYLRIFNRWGEMVYEKKDFNIDDRSAGWDGVYKGQRLPSGVFVYTSQMICVSGEIIEKKGSVMIVR
jgi:gliding motility-associated-like protein